MSHSQKLVNQQLAWCSTLIKQFEGKRAPWLEDALLQTLTWHLQAGYCAFLQELAASQQLSAAPSNSIVSVIHAVSGGRSCPAEFNELKALELGESWLSLLLSRPTSPTSLSAVAVATQSSAAVDVIAMSGQSHWGLAEAKQALAQLRALIERNRALGQEC